MAAAVGMGFSQHAGMVIVADGTEAAAKRLQCVLTNDPASGVMRHADAGYEIAIQCAKEQGLILPMLETGHSAESVMFLFSCSKRAIQSLENKNITLSAGMAANI